MAGAQPRVFSRSGGQPDGGVAAAYLAEHYATPRLLLALLLGMKTRLQELVQVGLVIGCLKFSV